MSSYSSPTVAEFPKTPIPVIYSLLKQLPKIEARRTSALAQLTWLVGNALGVKDKTVEDWLPGFARTPDQKVGGPKSGHHLPEDLRFDMAIGTKLGLVTQEFYDALM